MKITQQQLRPPFDERKHHRRPLLSRNLSQNTSRFVQFTRSNSSGGPVVSLSHATKSYGVNRTLMMYDSKRDENSFMKRLVERLFAGR